MLTTNTPSRRGLGRRVMLVGLTLAALTVGAFTPTTAPAAADTARSSIAVQRPPQPPVSPDVANVGASASSASSSITTSTNVRSAAAYSQVAYVRVYDALLRSRPSIYSTKLDVSQPWDKVTVYCWHDYTDSSHLVWFKAHPHHSRYTGWMRADLLYRPGPLPPRC